MIQRKSTRKVLVRDVAIGGNNPIPIQSMTTSRTDEIDAIVREIHRLEEAGCQLIRASLPDMKAVQAIPKIKSKITIPLIGDIHFNYELAL